MFRFNGSKNVMMSTARLHFRAYSTKHRHHDAVQNILDEFSVQRIKAKSDTQPMKRVADYASESSLSEATEDKLNPVLMKRIIRLLENKSTSESRKESKKLENSTTSESLHEPESLEHYRDVIDKMFHKTNSTRSSNKAIAQTYNNNDYQLTSRQSFKEEMTLEMFCELNFGKNQDYQSLKLGLVPKRQILKLPYLRYQWFVNRIYMEEGSQSLVDFVINVLDGTEVHTMDKKILIPAIHLLLLKENMNLAFELWNQLEDRGFLAPSFIYSIGMNKFIKQGDMERALYLYIVLKEVHKPHIAKNADMLLRSMLRERQYWGLEQVADDLWEHSEQPVDTNVLQLLLNAYGKAENIPRMQEMCLHVIDRDEKIRAPVIAMMVSAYSKMGMHAEALDMVDILLQTNDNLDDKLQRILISTILRISGTEEAKKVLDMLETHKLLESSKCHTMLAKAYAKQDQYGQVAKVFDNAKALGLHILPTLYTIAIDSALKAGKIYKAKTLLSECKPLVDSAEMNHEAYHTLRLHLYSRLGHHHRVRSIWEQEIKYYKDKDGALSLYIDSAGRNGTLSTVLNLWKTLNQDGCNLNNENIINSYLEALMKKKRQDMAIKAFKIEFSQRDAMPSYKTFITLLQPLADAQNVALVRSLKTHIWQRYPSLIGDWKRAEKLLQGQIEAAHRQKK
ncbi:hypothetical protein INT43_001087 [Umbelopsis isabellina]|uniref:Uncharacterized protein n=1 Tax=Mortierella isabellina TaxID=91625 RepID=A0A8H7PKL9_MORIS|nr:hypothetical protein INT43_001087 [Umbelopsis isabellina]